MNNTFLLFVETRNMDISEINERLLSIIVSDIEYIDYDMQSQLKKQLDVNCVFLKTSLDEFSLNFEINELLKTVGYFDKYVLCKIPE